SSGLPLDVGVETPESAAQIIAAHRDLGLSNGLLITVPVPEADALSDDSAEAAILKAVAEAEANDLHGKDVTPYLLERIVALTDGTAQRANTALLINNARTAAQIAVALAKLS
ncbi:MAG: pseudouridine-5'-phosphate glycosidase, partial [Chloroflexi bacterium]|nr:pseudouridine-5'-phosphate glycosidase [Chloroflexota bacterium]